MFVACEKNTDFNPENQSGAGGLCRMRQGREKAPEDVIGFLDSRRGAVYLSKFIEDQNVCPWSTAANL